MSNSDIVTPSALHHALVERLGEVEFSKLSALVAPLTVAHLNPADLKDLSEFFLDAWSELSIQLVVDAGEFYQASNGATFTWYERARCWVFEEDPTNPARGFVQKQLWGPHGINTSMQMKAEYVLGSHLTPTVYTDALAEFVAHHTPFHVALAAGILVDLSTNISDLIQALEIGYVDDGFSSPHHIQNCYEALVYSTYAARALRAAEDEAQFLSLKLACGGVDNGELAPSELLAVTTSI